MRCRAPATARFDVFDDTRSQAYGGVAAETAKTDQAVSATHLQVVLYKGKVAQTFFFSTSGGHTENNEFSSLGFGQPPVPYLRGVDDPYEADRRLALRALEAEVLGRPDQRSAQRDRPARQAAKHRRHPAGRVAADRARQPDRQRRHHDRQRPSAGERARPARHLGLLQEEVDRFRTLRACPRGHRLLPGPDPRRHGGRSDRPRDQPPHLDAGEPCAPARGGRRGPRADRHRPRLHRRRQRARDRRGALAEAGRARRRHQGRLRGQRQPRGAARADRAEPREPGGPRRSISTTSTASTRRLRSPTASARSRSTATRARSGRSGSRPSPSRRSRRRGRWSRSRRCRTTSTSESAATTTSSTTARRTGSSSSPTTR